MEIAARMKHSWEVLSKRAVSAPPIEVVEALRDWLRDEGPRISATTRVALGGASGVKLFLETDSSRLPLTPAAVEAVRAALAREVVPTDPIELVALVDQLCHRLAVFVREDDCCPECQYDLELFVADGRFIDVCGMDHCFESPPQPVPRGFEYVRLPDLPPGARPARRDEVVAHFPTARLA
jgi:hypothetical protein